jgi:acyl-CoA thioesterase
MDDEIVTHATGDGNSAGDATDGATEGADRVARELHRLDPSAATFGIELIDAAPDSATVRMSVRTEHCNGFGILHGGMTFLLADSAMAFASNAGGRMALASSAGIDWLAPVPDGDVLTARAVRRDGGAGRSALWDVTITNAAGETVALMRGRTRTVNRPTIDPEASR